MNILKNGYAFGVFAAVAIAGCGGSGGGIGESSQPAPQPPQPPAGDTGYLNLSVSDAPIKDATKVCIRFDGVELKHADSDDRVTIDFDEPEVVNLLANQGANSQPIVSGRELPAGEYQWIRLKVAAERGLSGGAGDMDLGSELCDPNTENSYLVRDEPGGYELNNLYVPSGSQRGLQLIKGIIIPVNRTGAYTAEWDVGKSFNGPPGQKPDVMMKPVVKLVANNEVGTLVGQVDDELIALDSCDAEFAPSVYVFDDGVEPNPLPEDDAFDAADAIATGLVEQQAQDDDSMPWRYSIGFLLAGNYEAAYTCNGNDFIPLAGKPAEILVDGITTVDFLAEDAPGTLTGQVASAFFDPGAPEYGLCDQTYTPTVFVFEEGDTPNFDAPFTTAEVMLDDILEEWRYAVPLQAANYVAAFSCTGTDFFPDAGKPAAIEPALETEVDFLTDDAPAPVGTLFGEVNVALLDAAGCDTAFEPAVYVFGDGVTPGETETAVATGLVTEDTSSGLFGYSIDSIVAGSYEAAFTCTGTSFVPVDGKPAEITIGGTTEVSFDATDAE